MSATITETVTSTSVDDDRLRPLPEVPVFEFGKVTPEQVVAGLIQAGGAVIRNAVDTESLAAIDVETRPYIEKDRVWNGEFFPRQTRRVNSLASKSKAFMEKVTGHKLYQDVSDIMLSTTSKNWLGEKQLTCTSKPQVNATVIFSIGPGATDQPLHRDDMGHHNITRRMEAKDYKIGQDLGIGWFVGARKTTKANGATRFIPGSHLWDADTPPSEDLTYYAELNPGDAFIMLSSCFHGGSANTTDNDERLVYTTFMTKGFLRQEENQYLNNDPEKLKVMYDDDTILKLIGYDISAPFLGWINTGNPLTFLRPELAAKGKGDLY
ncbi:hypothetical protein A1O3_07798 [Capronia epimyces CBS 606.96]|uniref:Phytanoyl-CoA dioxygenase n=1 Tax=Capronia epimyces CBS 606.96 TaxID=1182542 RepID=W9YAX1_9EURO|nr:uncharacterized protein A1O3_07798 [Capronia epimyces CBS 606.96]EXJ79519.1 hypothetical protein A1O3_07798 [Capronia epimyces CBS 606.96]